MAQPRARFVVHEHRARRAGLHYDLRLEREGVLMDWAFRKEPPLEPGIKRFGVKQPDHGLEWLGFEGTIDDGYGAGEMRIWDSGTYELVEEKGGLMKIRLEGSRLRGEYVLLRFREGWLFFRAR